MAYGEFYVEQQGWAHWPKVLIMCRKNGRGVTRRRYVPEVKTGEGMGITDELREYAWQHMTNNDEIRAIADRIDAAHERVVAERDEYLDSCHLWDFKCSTMVELPRDADGEVIHVGDTVRWGDTGEPFEVKAIIYRAGCETEVGDGEQYGEVVAIGCHHYHAPTVEDVLREFVTEFSRDDTELCDDEVIERFASRLQLREDA